MMEIWVAARKESEEGEIWVAARKALEVTRADMVTQVERGEAGLKAAAAAAAGGDTAGVGSTRSPVPPAQ